MDAPAETPPPGPSVLERARASPVTFALVAINVAVFGWVWQHGGAEAEGNLLRFGSNEPLHLWAGEYWRIASYMFLHAGILHLAINMYASVGWSTALERALGPSRFLFVYLLSGVAGGCASAASGWAFGPHESVGASGALFGVIGGVLALRQQQLQSFAAFFADRGVRSLLLQLGIWTLIGMTVLHLDNAAHAGGLVAGFAATWLFTQAPARGGWLILTAALGALFMFAAHPWWTPEGRGAARLLAYARSYETGQAPDGRPWPENHARAERFLTKGCQHGSAPICFELASVVARGGEPDAAARSSALRKRACEIDPGMCTPLE